MWLILQQEKPDDYVVATGEAHSVGEFAQEAFEHVGLDWQDYVKSDDRLLRPLDVSYLRGDYSKARRELGWEPKVTFHELVKIMVEADLDHWRRWQKGERFPWDAPNYPSENGILSRKVSLDR